MADNFKKIEPEAELPERVKWETLSNLDVSRLILDIVDLFFIKPGNAMTDSLSAGYSRVEDEHQTHN